MAAHSRVLCLLFLASITLVSGTKSCETNPTYNDHNKFEQFFDNCFLDTTDVNIFGQSAQQIQAWFNEETYPVYITVCLLMLLFCVIKEIRGNTEIARYNFIRLQGLLLLMRLGLALSMTPWLWAAIRQQRPCYCMAADGTYQPLISGWGMPSGLTFTSALIATHFMETLSIPIGFLWILVTWGAAIASGQFSFGQSLVGIVFGVVLHFYSSRTPIFLRIIDFVATLIAGFVSILLAMRAYDTGMDFSFAVNFLIGLVWQVYAFTLLFVSFEWDFMRKALRKSVQSLHDVDFLYFRPLNSPTPDSDDVPSFKTEANWTVFITISLVVILFGSLSFALCSFLIDIVNIRVLQPSKFAYSIFFF